MTARSHETIRVGLRRIIRDASVSPKVRMDAIKLLMRVEGLMEKAGPPECSRDNGTNQPGESPNTKRMRELLAQEKEENAG
jgi:hypothetical protein